MGAITWLRKTVVGLGLALLFFLVLTPLSLLIRALGTDLLKLRIDRDLPSYWVNRYPPGPEPKSLKDQY